MGLLTHNDVLSKLKNQTLRIEGLQSTFAGWTFAVNPAVEQVREDVENRLYRYFMSCPKHIIQENFLRGPDIDAK